jgi:uncharacterized protein
VSGTINPDPQNLRQAGIAAGDAPVDDTTPAVAAQGADADADADVDADAVFDGSTQAEIDALHALCEQLNGFGAELSVEWVDGFLTALLSGRRAIPVSEWLPALAGDAFDRAFGDPQSAEPALKVLHDRWRVIAGQLDPEALLDAPDEMRLAPLIVQYDEALRAEIVADGMATAEQAEEELLSGGLWADGFLAAIEAFADDWPSPEALGIEDEELAHFFEDTLERIVHLSLPKSEIGPLVAERYQGEEMSRDDLIDEACFAAQDLRLYWLDHPAKSETRSVGAKVGRNDPCTCGSGKKFKKCCGA